MEPSVIRFFALTFTWVVEPLFWGFIASTVIKALAVRMRRWYLWLVDKPAPTRISRQPALTLEVSVVRSQTNPVLWAAHWLGVAKRKVWRHRKQLLTVALIWTTGALVQFEVVPVIDSMFVSVLIGLATLLILRVILVALAAIAAPLAIPHMIANWLTEKVVALEILTTKAWLLGGISQKKWILLVPWVGKKLIELMLLWYIGRFVQTSPLATPFFWTVHHVLAFPDGFRLWLYHFQQA
jgi:hypothetical protein